MVHSSICWSAAAVLVLAASTMPVAAQTGAAPNLSGGKVKVGVLTDIAGPTAKANG